MNTQWPSAPSVYSPNFLNQIMQSLTAYFGLAVAKDEETHRIILRSPNGTKYDVTVSDVGALVISPTDKIRA